MKKITKLSIITMFAISAAIAGCSDDDTGEETEVVTVVKIADTGQVDCASGTDGNEAMASCSADTASVEGQDGNYIDIPAARSFSGPTAHSTFTSDHTTSDNVTGLAWKTCSEGQELVGATCDGDIASLTWEEAIASCEALNSLNDGTGYAGIDTWRLPGISELRTLVDYSGSTPAIDTSYFPDTPADWYWSSDDHRNPNNAFGINFDAGNVLWWTKPDTTFVRCVSSIPEGGRAVELAWTKCSMDTVSANPEMDTTSDCSNPNGQGTWKDALAACENLEFAGRSDWRLPSVAELHSLIDVSKREGVFIDQDLFPDTPGTEAYYWSSTTFDGLADGALCTDTHECAWYVNFNDGYVEGRKIRSQKEKENYVRCVAGP